MADATNYEFKLINEFAGYNSANDKTNISEKVIVGGSQNVLKRINGNLANRPGMKRRGSANTTLAKVDSEFVWYSSRGITLPVWTSNGKLQVEFNSIWYDLLTGITLPRFVYDTWWNNTLKKDKLIMVHGDANILSWSGGITKLVSGTSNTLTKFDSATTFAQDGFTSTAFTTIGSSTTQFDITNPSGTTFRYTFDGTGTDPTISATTVPVGTYVLLAAQNFAAGNNGLFLVTGSGANYFEVTNAAGAAESNKTIGTGYIYVKYTKVININGTPYAYTGGESTATLTGVTPSAAAIVSGDVATQAVIVEIDKPASGAKNDFCKVVNNQLYIGSYSSRLIYISKNSDYTDFTVGTAIGDGELVTLGANGKGIAVRQGNAYVGSGTSFWEVISFTSIDVSGTATRLTKVDRKPVATLSAPFAHEFIDVVGDTLVYLSQDQQVRTFGDYSNIFTPAYPSFSQAVYTELQAENFIGGALKAIGDYIYLTAPVSGKVYLHQTRQSVDSANNIVSEKLWHSPMIWNATRVDEIDGIVHAFSNANPQLYKIWDTGQWHDDSPADESLPYTSILAMSYRNHGRRQGLISFDKVFTEGYFLVGSEINLKVNYNYQGATAILTSQISSDTRLPYNFSGNKASSLGDSSLGDNPLGDSLTTLTGSQDILTKLKSINQFSLTNCFEYQIIISSEKIDSQWEILAIGTNANITDQQATFLINK